VNKDVYKTKQQKPIGIVPTSENLALQKNTILLPENLVVLTLKWFCY